MTMYYFNNIYIYIERDERNQKEVLREWKKERERMRGIKFLSFSWDASYMGCMKPFIGFIIWTPITHIKDE